MPAVTNNTIKEKTKLLDALQSHQNGSELGMQQELQIIWANDLLK